MLGSAAGLTAAGLEGLHAAAERHVGDQKVPGLVALVARGGQVHVIPASESWPVRDVKSILKNG